MRHKTLAIPPKLADLNALNQPKLSINFLDNETNDEEEKSLKQSSVPVVTIDLNLLNVLTPDERQQKLNFQSWAESQGSHDDVSSL